MLKKLKNIPKEDLIKYIIIMVVTLLLCQNFLQMHYSSDTYVLYALGYMKYPSKYFLLDGRLISTVVCYLAGILKIPIKAYIIGMDFIGIIFVGLSICTVVKLLEKLIKPKSNILKLSIICASFLLVLNQFTLEYLLFPESAVMCMGLFLIIQAVRIMIENPKHKYLKIFMCLLAAGISYQGLLNIFPTLAILFYLVKEIKDERPYKEKEKEFFIDMVKLAILVLISLGICMALVKIGTKALNSEQDRKMHLMTLEAVRLRGETVMEYMDELWNECMAMLPKHTNTIVLVISTLLIIALKPKKEYFLQYLLILIVSFGICIVPMFMFNTGVCGRVNVPLTMLWGVSIIVLLTLVSEKPEKKILSKIIYMYAIVSCIINSIFIMQNISEHIAANRVDENTGATINYLVKEYEEKTGNTVTKFSFMYDRNPQQYAVGIKPMQSLTERKFACSWCIRSAVDFYCHKDLKYTAMPREIRDRFKNIDYKEFSEEQIIIEGDTLYMLVY